MKKILLSLLLLFPVLSHANDVMAFDGECYVQGKDSTAKTCQIAITSENGSSYQMLQLDKKYYLEQGPNGELLNLDKANYVSETPSDCYSTCDSKVGTSVNKLKNAKRFFRDYKTKKIVTEIKDGDWICNKQTQGDLEVCYVIK